MEGNKIYCEFHVIGYKHTGRFDQYATLVAQAFKELKTKEQLITFCSDTTVAIYEPQRGSSHVEGNFYVGTIVEEKPSSLPDGSEYIYVNGSYASATGLIKNMSEIYDFVVKWIRDSGNKPIWPDALFIERYEFPIPEDQLILEEEVEVLLPVE